MLNFICAIANLSIQYNFQIIAENTIKSEEFIKIMAEDTIKSEEFIEDTNYYKAFFIKMLELFPDKLDLDTILSKIDKDEDKTSFTNWWLFPGAVYATTKHMQWSDKHNSDKHSSESESKLSLNPSVNLL